MVKIQQAVILAGGRGTRLGRLTDFQPKPMVDVNGVPFLNHLLKLLSARGITEVLILTGYLGSQIEDYFGPEKFGLKITYLWGPEALSPGERLIAASGKLSSSFLLTYADNYALFDLESLSQLAFSSGAPVVLSVCPKPMGNVVLNHNGSVKHYLQDRSSGIGDYVEVGFSVISRDPLLGSIAMCSYSLSGALESLAESGLVWAHKIEHPYFSVSDEARLGIIRLAFSRRKILLLDRDGVINVKARKGEYISRVSDFQPIESTWAALKILAQQDFSFIVITNQAGVARGMVTQETLGTMHARMIEDFSRDGISVIGVYVCPHNWDDGCACRKPRAGMFFEAAAKHHLMLNCLVYVGDDVRDHDAALAAGCTPIIVGSVVGSKNLNDLGKFSNLMDAVPFLIDFYANGK